MVEIPQKVEYDPSWLARWYEMAGKLKVLKTEESILRKKIFSGLFPEPKEGTNKHDLGDGFRVEAQYPYTREIDLGAFAAIKEAMREANVNPDELIKWKPELKKTEYNKLTEEQKKIFDQCLVVKPGSITLSILKNKGKGES